jgi:hypothetical protein
MLQFIGKHPTTGTLTVETHIVAAHMNLAARRLGLEYGW